MDQPQAGGTHDDVVLASLPPGSGGATVPGQSTSLELMVPDALARRQAKERHPANPRDKAHRWEVATRTSSPHSGGTGSPDPERRQHQKRGKPQTSNQSYHSDAQALALPIAPNPGSDDGRNLAGDEQHARGENILDETLKEQPLTNSNTCTRIYGTRRSYANPQTSIRATQTSSLPAAMERRRRKPTGVRNSRGNQGGKEGKGCVAH